VTGTSRPPPHEHLPLFACEIGIRRGHSQHAVDLVTILIDGGVFELSSSCIIPLDANKCHVGAKMFGRLSDAFVRNGSLLTKAKNLQKICLDDLTGTPYANFARNVLGGSTVLSNWRTNLTLIAIRMTGDSSQAFLPLLFSLLTASDATVPATQSYRIKLTSQNETVGRPPALLG